jgi:agmatinase
MEDAEIAIIGLPIDATGTGRRGADLAPDAIRIASDLIETYSPYLDLDLEQRKIADLGNIQLIPTNWINEIEAKIREQAQSNRKIAIFGGEHSISIPVIKVLSQKYLDLKVLVLDAHTDLRDEYNDSRYNHACVSRRIAEIVGWQNLKLAGVRSGTGEEFKSAQKFNLILNINNSGLKKYILEIKDHPLYVSVDLDVFDPGLMSGVSVPEPGGISYQQFLTLCQELRESRLIGFDLVELCPPVDSGGNSAVVAASVAREMMLLL